MGKTGKTGGSGRGALRGIGGGGKWTGRTWVVGGSESAISLRKDGNELSGLVVGIYGGQVRLFERLPRTSNYERVNPVKEGAAEEVCVDFRGGGQRRGWGRGGWGMEREE